jgi:ankyrin repeat protein
MARQNDAAAEFAASLEPGIHKHAFERFAAGGLDAVHALLSTAGDDHWRSYIGRCTLRITACAAAKMGNKEQVLYLCSEMKVPIFAFPQDERQRIKDKGGAEPFEPADWTPLASAIKHEHEDLALALIDLPNQALECPDNETSPLHLAAEAGMLRLAWQLVLQHGLDIDYVSGLEVTPICSAAMYAQLPVVEFFLQLYRARGRFEEVLERVSPKIPRPLLHYCCQPRGPASDEARKAIARMLVRQGVDVWAVDTRLGRGVTMTALQEAAIWHNLPLVEFFITECKMPVNMGTTNSGTPLMNVCRINSRDAGKLVKVLVEKLGADPTLRDYRGLAPVDFAVESGTTEAHKYVERAARTYKAPTPGADKVTVMAATADTKTDCQQKDCFAHSTCRGKLNLTGLPLDVIGLRERQDWLVGDAMSELACQGALPALKRHLAFACDEFCQTRWAKMSLYAAAAVAAKKGHSEFVLYLCKERGVAVNLITYPILHEVLTPLVNAIAYGSEDLALELLALPGQDLDLERHVSPMKGTLLHLATLAEKEGVVKSS